MDAPLNGQLFEGSIKGGTPQLFSTKEMLSDKARYPRGYTPERMRDVVENGPRIFGPTVSGSQSSPAVIEARKAAALPARRVRDNLARSTVPMGGALKQTHISTGAEFDKNHITGGETGGTYRHPTNPQFPHRISLAPGMEDNPVLIHEVGHLDSYVNERDHSSYRTKQAQGAEEAYADDFAVRNFRDRRGRPPTPDGGYTRDVRAGKTDPAFAQQYKASRQTAVDHVQAELDRRHPLLPANHVPGQMPLLQGSMTGHGPDEVADWKYNAAYETDLPGAGLQRETETPHLTNNARAIRARRAQVPLHKVKRTP